MTSSSIPGGIAMLMALPGLSTLLTWADPHLKVDKCGGGFAETVDEAGSVPAALLAQPRSIPSVSGHIAECGQPVEGV